MPDGSVETYYPRGKYDSTLVPIDAEKATSGKPWKNMILDDELYALFSAFTKKGARVIFISDSCFSGSIARNEKNKYPERFVPLHKVFRAKSFDEVKIIKPATTSRTTAPPQLGNLYLTLTAADANETALDGSSGEGPRMGLFTSNLVKALNAKGTTAMNYTQLMTKVGKTVSKIASEDMNHNQNPQLDARYGDPKTVIFTIPAAAAVKPPPGGKKKDR